MTEYMVCEVIGREHGCIFFGNQWIVGKVKFYKTIAEVESSLETGKLYMIIDRKHCKRQFAKGFHRGRWVTFHADDRDNMGNGYRFSGPCDEYSIARGEYKIYPTNCIPC